MSKQLCKCGGQFTFQRYCGVLVCDECDNHKGLARCYCGWSSTYPNHGREELVEMGETIEPEEGLFNELEDDF